MTVDSPLSDMIFAQSCVMWRVCTSVYEDATLCVNCKTASHCIASQALRCPDVLTHAALPWYRYWYCYCKIAHLVTLHFSKIALQITSHHLTLLHFTTPYPTLTLTPSCCMLHVSWLMLLRCSGDDITAGRYSRWMIWYWCWYCIRYTLIHRERTALIELS